MHVQDLVEGSTVTLEGNKADGSTYTIPLNHTFNDNQIKWFKAGSALNAVRPPQPASCRLRAWGGTSLSGVHASWTCLCVRNCFAQMRMLCECVL